VHDFRIYRLNVQQAACERLPAIASEGQCGVIRILAVADVDGVGRGGDLDAVAAVAGAVAGLAPGQGFRCLHVVATSSTRSREVLRGSASSLNVSQVVARAST
jgi:hypothetical protein